jgi:hypothetical protein
MPKTKTLDQQSLNLVAEEGASTENIPATAGNALKKPVDTLAMAPAEGGRITVIERRLYFMMAGRSRQKSEALKNELLQCNGSSFATL